VVRGCVLPLKSPTCFWIVFCWQVRRFRGRVGAELGTAVGAAVGAALGAELGAELGAAVGAAVGAPLGEDVACLDCVQLCRVAKPASLVEAKTGARTGVG